MEVSDPNLEAGGNFKLVPTFKDSALLMENGSSSRLWCIVDYNERCKIFRLLVFFSFPPTTTLFLDFVFYCMSLIFNQ